MGEFVKVASASEIAPSQARLVNIKGREIALFNIEGSFFALDNACTHEEGPLVEGDIEGHEVTCPWHGAKFDIRTRARHGVERALVSNWSNGGQAMSKEAADVLCKTRERPVATGAPSETRVEYAALAPGFDCCPCVIQPLQKNGGRSLHSRP